MKKRELFEKTKNVIAENQSALQTMYEGLSKTQKKKVGNDKKVKKTLDRHGIKEE